MAIDFEGELVKPSKLGVYRCPYACHTSGYPAPKWKTEKGFRQHMTKCSSRPSRIRENEAYEVKRRAEQEQQLAEAIDGFKYKIGDKINYVEQDLIKPRYEQRGHRMVKVRYEDVYKFSAANTIIRSFSWYSGSLMINGSIYAFYVTDTYEEAQEKAAKKQKAHDEANAFASFCR
jgi:hypothetical protein